MRKYGGRIIFEGRDEFGLVEIVQDESGRTLHFGTPAKQSSMSLSDPLQLQLSYTRAMVAPLLFRPEPARVLLIGLGGGSLAKFFLRHFPLCQVDAVELREIVVRAAREHFHLPDTPRLRVHVGDAAQFVASASFDDYGDYDLILVDAFVASGISHAVTALAFFEDCALRLARDGMVAVNLWSRDRVALSEMIAIIRDGLDRPVWRLPVPDKDNIIALAGHPPTARTARTLSDHARALSDRYGVEFPDMLRLLRKHNAPMF